MGAPYNNIDTRIENALASWVQGCITVGACSLTDYGCLKTGLDDETMEENRIIISVVGAEELIARSGIWNSVIRVTVYTNMDSTGGFANHKANVGVMRDLFMESGLITALNSATADVIFSGVGTYKVENQIEERSAVGSISFGLIASAT